MKKTFIIIVIALALVIGFLIFRSNITPPPQSQNTNESGSVVEQLREPNTITVGLYRTEQNGPYVDLLEELLKQKGFIIGSVQELPDPDAINQQSMTIFYRSSSENAIPTLQEQIFTKGTFRKGIFDSISQDVVIGTWDMNEISWGDLEARAQALMHPEKSTISIQVVNAGAEPELIEGLTSFIKENGYLDVTVEKAPEGFIATKPILIYHDRFFKEVAKELRKMLYDHGYSDASSYRWRAGLATDIVIELGPSPAGTTTSIDEALSEE